MSACDSCRDPGHCCRSFHVPRHFKLEDTRKEVLAMMRAGLDGFGRNCEQVPFIPLTRRHFYGVEGATEPYSVTWTFSCPKLGEDGRCSIYETRPGACRRYEPKSDGLCVERDPMLDEIQIYAPTPTDKTESVEEMAD